MQFTNAKVASASLALDQGTAKDGGIQFKDASVDKALIEYVAGNNYLHISSQPASGEVLIAPLASGWVGLPHGTNPSVPADLPSAELDLYRGRIAQMGWHLRVVTLTAGNSVVTGKEVVLGVKGNGGVGVTLADADCVAGRVIVVKAMDAIVTFTVSPQTQSKKIDGASFLSPTGPYARGVLISDGSNWFVVSSG